MRIKAKTDQISNGINGFCACFTDVEVTDDNGNPITEIIGPITIVIPGDGSSATAHFGVYLTAIDIDCKEEK